MRTRYYLAAMALPLMFSCTQDEFGVQEDNGSNALQSRVNVGKVTFVDGDKGADTRFDFLQGRWEAGDKFRLFLMDESNGEDCGFGVGGGEEYNSNNTHFMEQQVWNKMYTVANRSSSNFPFEYSPEKGAWVNDDAIVEGNYFAVKPATGGQQEELLNNVTNRRDVWVYINPVQKFDAIVKGKAPVAPMTDGLEENQFFLGYTQVYRNDKATADNELQLPVQMRPILANIDLRIQNTGNVPFRVEKMVISRIDGAPMPTLAYVRPCGNMPKDFGKRQDDSESYFKQQWTKFATEHNLDSIVAANPELCLGHAWQNATWQPNGVFEEFGPAFAQPYIVDNTVDECGNMDDDYYWTLASWTRTAARSVVHYSYPGEKGFTPYGCTNKVATPAYEYVIDFTGEDGNGVVLNTMELIRPVITLPHDMNMSEYVFTVYGQQEDTSGKWQECILKPVGALLNDAAVTDLVETDGRFTLPTLDPTMESDYIRAEIRFADFYPVTSRVVQTGDASDLLNRLESYYGKQENNFDLANSRKEYFYVRTLGDFEMTNELVNYVQALNNRYGIGQGGKAVIYFTATEGVNGSGSIIFPADLENDHAIDLFYFSKNAHIVNKGTQVIEKPIIYDYDKSEEVLDEAIRETICKADWYLDALSDGIDLYHKIEPLVANKLFGGIGSITNEGTLTLNTVVIDASNIENAIRNEETGTLKLINSVITNEGCGAVDVHNRGTMEMTGSRIWGKVHNESVLDILAGDCKKSKITKLYNYNECVNCGKTKAELTIAEGAELYIAYGSNGSKEGYLGWVYNLGVFSAKNKFINYPGSFIQNGSKDLAVDQTPVKMSYVVNYSGEQAKAVTLENGAYEEGIKNYCTLSVENYGYIYQADEYAIIKVFNNKKEEYQNRGVIENTVHGNISTTEAGETPTKYQVIIYTVEGDQKDIVEITDWLEKYHDYNKVVLKVGTLVCGTYDTFDKLHFANENGDPIEGEVEFANAETKIEGRATSADGDEIVHLAVNYVKVNGTVRLLHHTKLRVGQAMDPVINCLVYGDGQIEVQNNAALGAMGNNDKLDCKVYLYGKGNIEATHQFETIGENGSIQVGIE